VVDERAQPAGEAVRFDQVDEVAVARPLLELEVGQPLEALAFTIAERPAENGQARDVEPRDLCVDRRLELGRIDAHQHLPVADDDVLPHPVRVEDE
jgi:hypothetical protein